MSARSTLEARIGPLADPSAVRTAGGSFDFRLRVDFVLTDGHSERGSEKGGSQPQGNPDNETATPSHRTTQKPPLFSEGFGGGDGGI